MVRIPSCVHALHMTQGHKVMGDIVFGINTAVIQTSFLFFFSPHVRLLTHPLEGFFIAVTCPPNLMTAPYHIL